MKAKFVYVGIRVTDLQKSIEFYTKLLGMKVTNRRKFVHWDGEIVNLESENGNVYLELNYYEPGSRFDTEYLVGEGLDHLAFTVENLDQTLEEARSLGYPIVLELKDESFNIQGNRWAYVEDPNGIWIELFTPSSADALY
ncbi:MAG: VOC family protein [Candidatus Bathyarchaeota archaeon]|nr:MAG: VOC family protein [Candidatus Bathyarchaeota archaeon]